MSQITETEDFTSATNSSSQIDTMSAEAIIQRVLSENPGRPCITCSFQAEGMIVLNILRRQLPNIPVLFLDTGYHFAETYSYRDRMTAAWNLNLHNITPKQSVAEQEAELGILNRTDPGRCCHLRKVEPLFEALENYDIWFTGLRREQAPTRKNIEIIEHHALPSGKVLVKASPLAAWTWDEVWKRTAEERIPYLAPAAGTGRNWSAVYIHFQSVRNDFYLLGLCYCTRGRTHRNRWGQLHGSGSLARDWPCVRAQALT